MLPHVGVLLVVADVAGDGGHAGEAQEAVVAPVQFRYFDGQLGRRRRLSFEVAVSVHSTVRKWLR